MIVLAIFTAELETKSDGKYNGKPINISLRTRII